MMWVRIFIDGIAMSAVFNLATALIITINPAVFTAAYPKEIQKIAAPDPQARRHKWQFGLWVMLPVTVYGVFSAYLAGLRGFWYLFGAGYIEWFLINLGDFFGLDLYFREKMGKHFELPGTENHWCYTRKGWMKSLAVPEHFVLWPLVVCPLMALISAGLGCLLRLF